MALIAFGVYGLTANTAPFLEPLPALNWLTTLPAGAAILIGGAIALASWVLVSVRGAGESGVRMMFRFRRDGTAASIGDVKTTCAITESDTPLCASVKTAKATRPRHRS